jgi:hypothetical protein
MSRNARRQLTLAPLLAFSLALALASAATAAPKIALGTLAGTVTDAHGEPLAEATVTIQTSDGLKPHATHTDASGRFEFSRYRPGQYDLRAYAGGAFSGWSKRILIRTGKTTQVTLRVDTSAPHAR